MASRVLYALVPMVVHRNSNAKVLLSSSSRRTTGGELTARVGETDLVINLDLFVRAVVVYRVTIRDWIFISRCSCLYMVFGVEWCLESVKGRGVVLANSHPAKELRVNRCMNSLGHEIRLRGSKLCSGAFVFVTSTRTLASGVRGPRGIHRGIVRITLSCVTINLSPVGSAVFVRSRVPRLYRLAFCCVSLIAISHLRHGPAIGARVRVHGFRADVPMKFFACPVDRTTSVATFGTAAIPINRSRRPVVRRAHRVMHHFGRVCNSALMRPRVLLPSGTTYLHLPNASKGTGVDGSLNGYVCLSSATSRIRGGIGDVCASPARLGISSPNGLRKGAMFACLSTFYGPRRFKHCLPSCPGLSRLGTRCAHNKLKSVGIGGFLTTVVRRRLAPVHRHHGRFRGSVPTVCSVLHGKYRATHTATATALSRMHGTVGVGCFSSIRLVTRRTGHFKRRWGGFGEGGKGLCVVECDFPFLFLR